MLQRLKYILLFLVLVSGVPGPLGFAAPRLTIKPPAQKISIGQSTTLTLRLEWPQEEGPYEINPLEPKLENLSMERQNQSQETGAMVVHTIAYEFRPLGKGIAVIYPFEISYRKSETKSWIPVLVPEQKIRVVSSFPFQTILTWLAILGGSLASVFVGLKIGTILRARKAAKNIPSLDPRQRIYAKAEESIATFTSPNPKEKLTHWSNQLRTVVAAYHEIPSTIVTSTEILSRLKSQGLPAGEWNEISRLFQQLNELQFSRADIPSYDLEQMQKTLLQYVKGKIIIGTSNS